MGSDPDDFMVRTQEEMASVRTETTKTMTTLLAAIAGVSLLVGGIGIMNIMLVSVTERTREIGLRMAIGARGKDVLMQFLVEAVVLSLFGGLLGIGMGYGLSAAAEKFLQWPTSIPPNAIGDGVRVRGWNRRIFWVLSGKESRRAGSDRSASVRIANRVERKNASGVKSSFIISQGATHEAGTNRNHRYGNLRRGSSGVRPETGLLRDLDARS